MLLCGGWGIRKNTVLREKTVKQKLRLRVPQVFIDTSFTRILPSFMEVNQKNLTEFTVYLVCSSKANNFVLVRTPLNAIIGMLDMTLNTELDNKQREYLTSVQFAADSLLRIVNDVLDIRYYCTTRHVSPNRAKRYNPFRKRYKNRFLNE